MPIATNDYFRIEGDNDVWQRRGSSIERYTADQMAGWDPAMTANLQTLSANDVETNWRDMLSAGSDRYGSFFNEYTNQTLKSGDIANYIGSTPLGSLPSRSEEQAGNVAGLSSGSAQTTLAKQQSGELPPPGDPYYQNSRQQGQPPQEGAAAAGAQQVQPSFQQVLQQVYATRPDLQAVYNPDGSAKNISDSRVAGIPTLEDWARTFGINESPVIKSALQQKQQGGSGAPSGTTGTNTGTPGAQAGGTGAPQPSGISSYVEEYKQVMEALGLVDLKTSIKETQKKYETLQNELNDKKSDINSNPWYTEGVRTMELRKLDEKYEGKMQILTGMLDIYNSEYQQALGTADQIVDNIQADKQQAKETASKAFEANQNIVLDYGVSQPFYTIDGTTMIRSSDGKAYSSYEDWVADGGGPNTYQMVGGLMTLKDQANFEEKATAAATKRSTTSKTKSVTQATATKYQMPSTVTQEDFNYVRDLILANKNNEGNWYDTWGEIADYVRNELELDPSDFDGLFWENLHPDGLKGFQGGGREV